MAKSMPTYTKNISEGWRLMKCLFVASSMNFLAEQERVMSILSNAWCDKGCEVKILLTQEQLLKVTMH